MREKDVREMQLEDLKSGIWRGTYYTTVTHFDGRPISRRKWATKEACERAYDALCKEYKQRAFVRKSVEFNF